MDAARPARAFYSTYRHLWLLLACLGTLSVPGCSGCLQTQQTAAQKQAQQRAEEQRKKLEEEQKRKEKEKEKPPFKVGRFMTQPNDLTRVESAFKPGHWTTASVDVIANNEDFNGELVTEPFDLDRMPFRLGTSRPALLPKGQRKFLELTIYVPPGKKGANITTRLLGRGGREVIREGHPTTRMPDHQFYFYVMAREPDRFSKVLTDLDSIRPPTGQLSPGPGDFYYRMMLPHLEDRSPLPSNPLCWTSIAYILWDDVNPTMLSPEQQQAMLDWLHWGGQLIVSGPGTLDAIKGSFIEPYMPAKGVEELKIAGGMLDQMNATWSKKVRPLRVAKEWSGQKLELHPEAVALISAGTEPLLAERAVGRGRIVVSAFRLGQRELLDWKGFDGFFNACLMRRPSRKYSLSGEAEVVIDWSNGANRFDPTIVSGLNYYSRDTDMARDKLQELFRLSDLSQPGEAVNPEEVIRRGLEEFQIIDRDETPTISAGVAGWNDFNAVAELAANSLKGGIVVPEASFVVWVLSVYLFVLVPLNWSIFRLLGHVEWAWIAAPVITLIFAVAVVRLAQLDVGFVRTEREINVVEVQGDYPRAHLTRYTSLYSSLSTTYDLHFEDSSALVQPFPNRSKMLGGQDRTTVNYRRDQSAQTADGKKSLVGLEGFAVTSNTQAMLHSEHMLDLGGGIVLKELAGGKLQVVNNTHLNLEGVGVLVGPTLKQTLPKAEVENFDPAKPEDPKLPAPALSTNARQVAWVGNLAPGASAELQFTHVPDGELWHEERQASVTTKRFAPPEALNIRHLIRLSEQQLKVDEVRLVGWTNEELGGLEIEPQANQKRHANLIVARLRYARRAAPEPDLNHRADVDKDYVESDSPSNSNP